MRRQEPVDKRLQPVRLADDHLRVFDQGRPIQLALEELRGAADAAERILDLVRETANELTVCLLLFEQSFFARNLELLVDVAKFEQQRDTGRVDHRNGT